MSTAQSPPDEANLPITNTLFPPPPSFYKSFTEAKVARHGELRTAKGKNRAHPEDDDDIAYLCSRTLKEEEEGELGNLEEELGKPRVDWVNEDGRWMCFGQMHTVSTAVSRVALVPFPLHLAFSLSCFLLLPPPPHLPAMSASLSARSSASTRPAILGTTPSIECFRAIMPLLRSPRFLSEAC